MEKRWDALAKKLGVEGIKNWQSTNHPVRGSNGVRYELIDLLEAIVAVLEIKPAEAKPKVTKKG